MTFANSAIRYQTAPYWTLGNVVILEPRGRRVVCVGGAACGVMGAGQVIGGGKRPSVWMGRPSRGKSTGALTKW